MNRSTNVLEPQKASGENKVILNQNELDEKIVIPYRHTPTK